MSVLRPDPDRSVWMAESAEAQSLGLTLSDALRRAAKQWPDREAVVSAPEPGVDAVRLTYQQLDQQVSKLATGLLSLGYQVGDRVAVWGPSYPEWILIEYAISRAGLVIVTLNPLYKQAELLYALDVVQVRCIFHADEVSGVQLRSVIEAVASQLPNLSGIYSFSDGVRALMAGASDTCDFPVVDPDRLFMIQYTSGTTGNPKAAQLSSNAIVTSALNAHRRYGIESGDRVCSAFPLFHVGGSGVFTPGAALIGATTLPVRIFKADRTLELLEQERCRVFAGVPTMVIAMLDDPSFAQRDLSALQLLIIGGAQVPVNLIPIWERRFGAQLINGYGQTETCGVTSSTSAGDPVEKKATTCGVAAPGVSIKLIDQAGGIVPHGVRGELCYQGPGRMMGYRDPEQTAQTIDAEGWLHSGDLATMDPQGFVTIVGRSKDMIIRGGENLSPIEIEGLLLQHPDVSTVAVVGVPDVKYGEEVCAVVVLVPDSALTTEELRSWCAERVSRWKVPRYVVFVDRLPLTPSGKVMKFKLREQMASALQLTGATH